MTAPAASGWFEDTPETRRLNAEEGLLLDITEAIVGVMQDAGVSKADLARRIGQPRASVSAMLCGASGDLSVRAVAQMLHALGYRLEIRAVPETGSGS